MDILTKQELEKSMHKEPQWCISIYLPLPLFTGDGQFYIRALSQNKVRLLNGTQYGVSEVEIGHAIESMAEVTSSDDHQASLQLHGTRAPTSATRGSSAAFHGQGGGWDILEPHFRRSQAEVAASYQQLAGQQSERVMDTLELSILAAHDGRVETLFLPPDVQKWGVFDPGTQQPECPDQKEAGDEPLLDLLAVQTYFKGAVVYGMAPEDIPGGTYTAAVLRY